MKKEFDTNNDLEYLMQDTDRNLNLIISEMTLVMEKDNENILLLQKQVWFQRMLNTVFGRNTVSMEEIVQNYEKIDLYILQILDILIDKNSVNKDLIIGLKNKLSKLYASQEENKETIGELIKKLEQKNESKNAYTVIDKIDKGKYELNNKFLSINRIMSQLKLEDVKDNLKMKDLLEMLEKHSLIGHEEILFSNLLEELLKASEEEAGIFELFYGNIREEYIAQIIEEVMYSYYTLPNKVRKMKNKRLIVQGVLEKNEIDLEYEISIFELYEMLKEAYIENIVQVEIEDVSSKYKEMQAVVEEYVDKATKLIKIVGNMVDSWNIKDVDLENHVICREYSDFMMRVVDNLNINSYIGKSILNSLENIVFWSQNLFFKYPYLRIAKFYNPILEEETTVGNNITISDDDEMKTLSETYREMLNTLFYGENAIYKREGYEFENLKYVGDFISFYDCYSIHALYLKMFLALYKKIYEKILFEANENRELLEYIYELCEKFSIEYIEDYEKMFIRKETLDRPYIEFAYDWSGISTEERGEASVSFSLEDYSSHTILVRCKNISHEHYTVSYEIIENEWMEFENGSCKKGKFVDVKWGRWTNKDETELILTKNNDKQLGYLKIKVYVKEEPMAVGYIK